MYTFSICRGYTADPIDHRRINMILQIMISKYLSLPIKVLISLPIVQVNFTGYINQITYYRGIEVFYFKFVTLHILYGVQCTLYNVYTHIGNQAICTRQTFFSKYWSKLILILKLWQPEAQRECYAFFLIQNIF